MDLAARGKTQPEVAQASRDDEADPARPYRCSPATDNDWPTHVNPQEMEERHRRENYAGQNIKCSLSHGSILQEFTTTTTIVQRRDAPQAPVVGQKELADGDPPPLEGVVPNKFTNFVSAEITRGLTPG